jgi:NDP-sugar pyrophosphorylase family protein
MLERIIEKLNDCGCSEVVVNAHHFANQIVDFLNNREWAMPVHLSDERQLLLDTGGGIKFAEHLIGKKHPFLAHNVDIISNVNLATFYSAHETDRLATLLVSDRQSSRYLLFNSENRLVGWTNTATGEVKSPYKHLDVQNCKRLAFGGIHVISPRIFEQMKDWKYPFSIIDFYLSLADKEKITAYQPDDLQLIDVGSIEKLALAEKLTF